MWPWTRPNRSIPSATELKQLLKDEAESKLNETRKYIASRLREPRHPIRIWDGYTEYIHFTNIPTLKAELESLGYEVNYSEYTSDRYGKVEKDGVVTIEKTGKTDITRYYTIQMNEDKQDKS